MPRRIFLLLAMTVAHGALPPDLPGEEVTEFESARTQLVTPSVPDKQGSRNHVELTWSAPGIEIQLNQAEKLLGMGMGAIFVPRMTDAHLEPPVVIFGRDGRLAAEGPTGEKIPVEPGHYIVIVGSGVDKQRLYIPVDVAEGSTVVLKPEWSGMVVETRSAEGELIGESYEVVRLPDAESFGRGVGQPQERIKDLTTWILPPGLYRLMRVGEDVGSQTNYVTVQLNPGELTRVELVFDPLTGNLIAGGVRPAIWRRQDDLSPWIFGVRLGGSVSLGTTIAEGERQNNYWAVIADLRLSLRYDRLRYYGFTEFRSRNSYQWIAPKDQDAEFLITTDALQFQSSWMRRIFPWMGPYARVSAWSHLLNRDFRHPQDSVIWVLSGSGDTLHSLQPKAALRIQPVGFPFRLGEGVGVSLRWTFGTVVELQAQTGVAWRQTWMRGVWVPLNKEQTMFAPGADLLSWGNENQMILRFHLGRSMTLDLVGELFLANFDPQRYEIEELSADLRILLTRHFEISYQQEFMDRVASGLKAEKSPRFESRNTLQLRFFFNY